MHSDRGYSEHHPGGDRPPGARGGAPGTAGRAPRRPLTAAGPATWGAIACAGAALALAGCGGSSKPGVAHLSSAAGATSARAAGGGSSAEGASPQQRLVAFARCMRAHGVPGFPEPVEGRIRFHKGTLGAGSPQFETAVNACRKLAPGTGPNGAGLTPAERQHRAAGLLAFASCMRAHGVRNFPDPTSSGELRLSMVTAAGVDVHEPSVQAAAKTCLPASGGVLTPAQIKRAESGGH
jgi:hypothetical protein